MRSAREPEPEAEEEEEEEAPAPVKRKKGKKAACVATEAPFLFRYLFPPRRSWNPSKF